MGLDRHLWQLLKNKTMEFLRLSGHSEVVGSETISILLKDTNSDILLATGTTVPTEDTDGYAKGCLFIDTDVADGTGALYLNKGTKDACNFTLVTQA